MMRRLSVKLLVAIVLGLCAQSWAQAPRPDPRELLKSARVAQANMDWKFTGQLRVGSGSKKIPFLLTISDGLVRYQFQDNGDVISLRLGERESRLEETRGGKTERIGPNRFGQLVRDTGISYEDLTLQFLYWPNAQLLDSDVILARDSWEIQLVPPSPGVSQYSRVHVWLSKGENALMKMEAYDANGRALRKYTVRSVMKRDDYWFLKQMEVSGGSKRPTFLELIDVVR